MGDDSVALDDVDRGVLHLLQVDARNTTAEEMADRVGVSASTVRNRISKLEEGGVIRGYRPVLDYERANLPLRVLFICTVRARERAEMAHEVMNVKGVITDALQDLDLEIRSSELLKEERVQPFNFHLGPLPDDRSGA